MFFIAFALFSLPVFVDQIMAVVYYGSFYDRDIFISNEFAVSLSNKTEATSVDDFWFEPNIVLAM